MTTGPTSNMGPFFMANQIAKQVAIAVIAGVVSALIVRKITAPEPTAPKEKGILA